jgi:hypothetical protein
MDPERSQYSLRYTARVVVPATTITILRATP